jgi:hypothetical protein
METAPIITATFSAPDGMRLDELSNVTHHLEIFFEVFSGVAGTLRLGLMVMITDAADGWEPERASKRSCSNSSCDCRCAYPLGDRACRVCSGLHRHMRRGSIFGMSLRKALHQACR